MRAVRDSMRRTPARDACADTRRSEDACRPRARRAGSRSRPAGRTLGETPPATQSRASHSAAISAAAASVAIASRARPTQCRSTTKPSIAHVKTNAAHHLRPLLHESRRPAAPEPLLALRRLPAHQRPAGLRARLRQRVPALRLVLLLRVAAHARGGDGPARDDRARRAVLGAADGAVPAPRSRSARTR